MQDPPTRRRVVGAMLGSAALAAMHARAAAFPERAIRIVVPYSVGVGPDVVARSVAERLTQQWGQPVVVDNKPGASGIVAFSEVRRSAPDGYTLFVADTATLAVNRLVHDTLPYDPVRDLAPLSLLFRATFVIFVGGEHRVRSIGELVHAAKAAPRAISYASLGNAHASQVAIESFARAAQLDLLHVPFKDAGALMTAVAAGDVDFTAFSMHTVAGLVAKGRLRPLAVASRSRLKGWPDLPTLAEAGGPPVEMHPWAALMAVANTPAPVLATLQAGIASALDSAALRQQVEGAGFEVTPSTPQELIAQVQADIATYAPLVREGRVARL